MKKFEWKIIVCWKKSKFKGDSRNSQAKVLNLLPNDLSDNKTHTYVV
jgi:hypothetical protein